jgi:hypothetical protein
MGRSLEHTHRRSWALLCHSRRNSARHCARLARPDQRAAMQRGGRNGVHRGRRGGLLQGFCWRRHRDRDGCRALRTASQQPAGRAQDSCAVRQRKLHGSGSNNARPGLLPRSAVGGGGGTPNRKRNPSCSSETLPFIAP